jgi:hypothetical protein
VRGNQLQPQNACASFTQVVSHSEMQQSSSNEQTIEQHASSSQNGSACSLQHEPAFGSPQLSPLSQRLHSVFAMLAQIESHTVSQHTGSMPQTVSQQSRLLQLAFACGKQQLPADGSPHGGGGQTTEQALDCLAWEAQNSSHCVVQQKMSMLQTAVQHASSLHHGVSCGSQQKPAHAPPHSNW